MGVDVYQPAPVYPNGAERERAVEASGALSLSDDPDLQKIVEHVRGRYGTAMAALSIVYGDWQYLIATAGLPGGPYSRRTSFCGHAIMEAPDIFCVSDAA
ncbi:hypothetical protein [Sphingomonas gellani]|uniref:hypothetical protein n=1 Tax=Sphingomonas gellani TaxID=1166340 RepID=UPI000B872770|nr:hypothetical protein [Sphingomonas gellani]